MKPITITKEAIQDIRMRFERDGFVVVHPALDEAEVEVTNQAVDGLVLPKSGDLRPIVDKGEVFLDNLLHPTLLSHVLALLGGNIVVMGSTVTIIPPGAEPMVWHEDGPRPWSYPAVGQERALITVRAGFFLEDLSQPDRGNLVVVPGSHRRPFHSYDRTTGEAPPGATQLLVPAGALVLFHNALWHSTAPNTMDHPRRVLYYGFSPSWHRIVDYVTPPPALLEALESRPADERALLRQLLGAVPPSGAPGFYFPDEVSFPGLNLITPTHAASGYD